MPNRTTYAGLSFAFALFAVYGSLVPLDFRAMPIDDAVAQFRVTPYLHLGIESRADFVANILLFVPLGFLCAGALRADRRGSAGSVAAGVAIVACSAALSVAIEFTQVFFPPRTVSLNDMLAETTGAVIGVVAWGLWGMPATRWLRQFFGERSRPALVVRLLTLYAAAFLVSQLLPLDIAITPGELAQKHQGGRLIVMPFGYAYPSTFSMAWDVAGDIALNAPLGALAVIGWTRAGRRRSTRVALLLGAAAVAAIELAQLFVFSRVSDVTDVATGSIGIALGVMAAGALSRAPVADPRGARGPALRWWPLLGALAWLAAVVAYAWYPFDFVLDRGMVRDRLPIFLAVPFRSYYFGSEFHAFTELTRKFLLAAPLGVLVRLAWAPAARCAWLQTGVLLGVLGALFTAIEVGQLSLPGRVGDATDILISEAGAVAGMYLVALLAAGTPARVAEAEA